MTGERLLAVGLINDCWLPAHLGAYLVKAGADSPRTRCVFMYFQYTYLPDMSMVQSSQASLPRTNVCTRQVFTTLTSQRDISAKFEVAVANIPGHPQPILKSQLRTAPLNS